MNLWAGYWPWPPFLVLRISEEAQKSLLPGAWIGRCHAVRMFLFPILASSSPPVQ